MARWLGWPTRPDIITQCVWLSSGGQKNGSRIANIFMSNVETKVISQSEFILWKCYMDERRNNIFRSLNKLTNNTPRGNFWVKISEMETTFLDTSIFKGESLIKKKPRFLMCVRIHFKPTETFQYTHCTSSQPPRVIKCFIKKEAPRLLKINSSITIFNERI